MVKHISGWIIEGVVASGKTTFIKELQHILANRHPARTKVYISEHYTERVLENEKAKGSLTAQATIDLASKIVEELESIAAWKSESKFCHNQGNAVIDSTLERFLGSHYANLKTLNLWHSNSQDKSRIIDIYNRLSILGFSVVILKLPDSLISQAVASTKLYRNAAWCQYLETIGNDEEVGSYYLNWQNKLLEFYHTLSEHIEIKILMVDPLHSKHRYGELAASLLQ
ncbi:hypothetical protein [Microcoleus sp. herbarium14]|uniref:hypothetical protein n=1 Tax=Microcoleus sp. herbarium14 TaxID=3055439 RepID=UPI002FD06448